MNNAYSAIGGVFEILNRGCDYDRWANYLKTLLSQIKRGSVGVDFGCGNGFFTRALYREGYIMTGVDISQEMLTSAISITRAEKIPCEFLFGDIAKLKLNFKADFITAINDCINYIPPSKLEQVFKNVSHNLKKGGTFIFDISSEYKLKNMLADNLFCEDGEQFTYIWFNKLFPDHIQIDLTLFTLLKDGTYSRADERHIQYIHRVDDIRAAAEKNGFSVEVEGHLGEKLPSDFSTLPIEKQRINFILKKL